LLVCGRDQQNRYQHAPNRYGNPNGQARLAKLSDGGGLQLWIMPDGAKRWRLAYRLAGVQKVLAVGVYPATGLREARDEAKKLLAIGQDPSLAKKLAKLSKAAASANSFDAIAAGLLEKKRREQKADRTILKFEWFMSLARPAIGARPARNRQEVTGGHRAGFSLRHRHGPRRKRPHGRAKGRARFADRPASRRDNRAQGLRRAFARHCRL
jgi:hypothetical protein